jgi:biofilm protein TabA
MALIGILPCLRAQLAAPGNLDAVFSYLEEIGRAGSAAETRLRQAVLGETQRVDLAGGAFALEQAYSTKERAEGFFESHRKYIDIQLVGEGVEWMEVAEASHLAVRSPYLPEKDLVVYEDTDAASILRVAAGTAAIFFPSDAHMPGLRGKSGPAVVRKTVVKVPVGR